MQPDPSFVKNREYFEHTEQTEVAVAEEMDRGLELLKHIEEPIVSIFGSSRAPVGSPEYDDCYRFANMLGENGYAVMTGGGPGIMRAGNSGAFDAGARSLGIKAGLLQKEQHIDGIFSDVIAFRFVFVRRFILGIKSCALVFYPGGFGTFNELFEFATLIQVGISDDVPMILVGKEFWGGMMDWIHNQPLAKDYFWGGEGDVNRLRVVDSAEEAFDIIEKLNA